MCYVGDHLPYFLLRERCLNFQCQLFSHTKQDFFFFKLKNRFYFIFLPHYFVENCRVILFMSLYLTGHIFLLNMARDFFRVLGVNGYGA